MHISEQKALLRQHINERIAALRETDRHAEGRTVSRVLLQHIPQGSTVCAYYPLKTEVDIRLLLNELLRRGDTVYLPVFDNNTMLFKHVQSLENLPKGALGIPEPPVHAKELTNYRDVDIVLVPGRAFTKQGQRLGRGSGGYDQWLEHCSSQHPNVQIWGIALQCQIVPEVPVEDHDAKMDSVVTAQEWYRSE